MLKTVCGATDRGKRELPELYSFDPLADARWQEFIERRQDSSIFHTVAWLEAIRRTYGYGPVVFTSSAPGEELRDGFLFCEISTWLSGRRLVSVPFSDHTALLADDPASIPIVLSTLKQKIEKKLYRYIEIRPASQLNSIISGLGKAEVFYWHKLDLKQTQEALYRSFHKDCVQRKIRRAERENLTYEEGTSRDLIRRFYGLQLLTRRRHGLPPQPLSWFHNLAECLGDNIKIRVSSVNGVPIASIITLTHKKSMTYKYGGSDPKYHNSGGMAFLFWRAIQDAKDNNLEEFDMGRSDCDNSGLINFKEHWGAERHELVYWAYPPKLRPDVNRWGFRAAKNIFSRLPSALLPAAGRLLYRHMG